MNGIVIAAIVIAVLILAAVLIWFVRMRHFKPTRDKKVQRDMLNHDLKETGFAYELRGDYFYSLMDCWQREMGYCRLYDESAHLFNMIMDCEPVTFSYGGKKWLIELWKGQYGITTGAEIGVYNTVDGTVDTKEFTGTFYEAVSDAERIPMSFVLKKNGKTIMKRKDIHWWLTGFKLGEFTEPDALTMDIRLKFPDRGMCFAFVTALQGMGYQKREYKVRGTEVRIRYGRPHSAQPLEENHLQRALVQQTNQNNCGLYKVATIRFKDTLDKLEFLKASVPELYEIFVNSLYAKGLYDLFGWLLDLIHGHKPKPEPPKPPCPEPPKPPCPEPPEPPCPEPPKPPCCPEPLKPPCFPEPPKPPCCPEPPKPPCCPEPLKPPCCPEPPKPPCCPEPPKPPCCPVPPCRPCCPVPPCGPGRGCRIDQGRNRNMEAEMGNMQQSGSAWQVREVEAEMRSISRMESSQDLERRLNRERRAEMTFIREPERNQYQRTSQYYAPETQYIPGVPEYSDDMDYGSYDSGESTRMPETFSRTSDGEDQDDWDFQ